MARSALANQTFNTLYTGMRSVATSKGVSFDVKSFNDGSAVVNFIVTARNVSVTQAVCVTPIMAADNKKVEKWRVADDERTLLVNTLAEALSKIRGLVASTRSILSKV